MPRKTKTSAPAQKAAPLQIPAEFLEQLIPGPVTPAQFEDIFQNFKKAFMERALGAEMSQHLGYKAGQAKPCGTTNHRNGKSAKTVLTDTGALDIEVPRDRHASFEPQLIGKHERRFTGFDDKIIAMYARGMTVREIQGFLAEMYALDVSPDLISSVTDAVMSEVAAWQSRPLEAMYPVVFFDALRVKIREDAVVRNKAVYLALGVLPDGTRDILGLWIENTEGAKFWMKEKWLRLFEQLSPVFKWIAGDCKGCRVVHGVGGRLRRTDRRGGQLGAHHKLHFMQPASVWGASHDTCRLGLYDPVLNAAAQH